MERTQANEIDSAAAQGHEFRYHIDYVRGIEYAFNCKLVYHCPFLQRYGKRDSRKVTKKIIV